MRLYIELDNLAKAVSQTPSVSRSTPREDRSSTEYDASYGRRYEGVAAGEAYDPDDKDVGKDWKGTGDTVNEETDQKLDSEKEDSEEKAKKKVKKSEALELLEDVNKSLAWEATRSQPHPNEVAFLKSLGHEEAAIMNGTVEITGKLRGLFNNWLCDKLAKSVSEILPGRHS